MFLHQLALCVAHLLIPLLLSHLHFTTRHLSPSVTNTQTDAVSECSEVSTSDHTPSHTLAHFTESQLQEMERVYTSYQFPDQSTVQELARKLELKESQVKVRLMPMSSHYILISHCLKICCV